MVGGACGVHGREVKCVQDCGGKLRKERNNWEDLCVDNRMMIKVVLNELG
jgi:hypothetical protein